MPRSTAIRSSAVLVRALRDARRARGWTQQQLAEKSGLRQSTVSNIERGAVEASLDTLWRILAALQLELVLVKRPAREPGAAWD